MKRGRLATALGGCLVLVSLPAAAQTRPACGSGGSVLLRNSPSPQGAPVVSVANGNRLVVVQRSSDRGWNLVQIAGYQGWVGAWEICGPHGEAPPAAPSARSSGGGQSAPSASATGTWSSPLDSTCANSGFGYRPNPFDSSVTEFHSGVDLEASCGTPVYAARDGTVIAAGWDSGYGYRVMVEHADGTRSIYAHLSQILVRSGANVSAGDLVGKVGSTGESTGCHLHFQLQTGPDLSSAFDPRDLIPIPDCPGHDTAKDGGTEGSIHP